MLTADYDALAIVSSNDTVRMIANWLIKTTGQGHRAQFFAEKSQAEHWLRSF